MFLKLKHLTPKSPTKAFNYTFKVFKNCFRSKTQNSHAMLYPEKQMIVKLEILEK